MQPGVNFRITDKNELVAVKDAAPPAILPFGKLSANDGYLRSPDGWSRRQADIADCVLGRLNWAESGRSTIAF